MPIIQGTKRKNPLDINQNVTIGVAFPLDETNMFTGTPTTKEQVKNNLLNLLLTKKGERVNVPGFGVGLQEFLFEHIARGDIADGIPNCLSKDSTFVSGDRQRPVTKKRLAEWMSNGKVTPGKNGVSWFDRNRRLIDFDYIPKELEREIVDEYENAKSVDRRYLLDYFITNQLSKLMKDIQEF